MENSHPTVPVYVEAAGAPGLQRVGHLLLGCAHGGIIEGEMWAYHSQFSVA